MNSATVNPTTSAARPDVRDDAAYLCAGESVGDAAQAARVQDFGVTSSGTGAGRVVILLTGMSGTGKSTVLRELARRGHRVVDTDSPGWIVERQTSDGPEPVWNLDRIDALLDEHRSGWLFLAGCVANQGEAYDRLDGVVLLSAPVDVLLARVAVRTVGFGSTAPDRAKIVEDVNAFEPLLRVGADHEIVTTVPVATVVAAVERLAAAVR